MLLIARPAVLWRRYVVALALITGTVTGAHLSSHSVLKAGASKSELIAVSGRQPMLSQRILYLIHKYPLEQNLETRRRLITVIRLFEESHEWLVNHPDLSDQLRAHYFSDGDAALDTLSRRFAALATGFLASDAEEWIAIKQQLNELGSHALMASLGEAVKLFEQEAEAHVSAVTRAHNLAFFGALIVLLLVAVFIFLPAHLSIKRAFGRLERHRLQLQRSLFTLKTRNKQLHDVREDLHRAATQDPVTGLFNRRALLSALSANLDRLARQGGTIGLLKVDLDHFKAINDTHGHKSGDQVLAEIAKRLTETVAAGTNVARVGGDEFVVLFSDVASVQDLEACAQDIIDVISLPIKTETAHCQTSASIGITVTNAREATRDQLLIEADLALYEAKRAGRRRARVYSQDLHEHIKRRRAFYSEIEKALENGAFIAFLQPQIEVATGNLSGCEMLARWRHPVEGIVAPAAFLDAAREMGLLRDIDLAVTENALDILERLHSDGFEVPCVSVNACAETLRDPHYVPWLLSKLQERHLSTEHLVVEILESTLIEGNNDRVLKTVESLSRNGIGVMLDDFGTGYATMATLTHLRLSGIKIDRSLIDPLPEDRAKSIVAALIALSCNLGMKVVAEGVEAPRHFAAVSELGCDVMQGFGIGHPMSEDDFRAWYDAFIREKSAAAG